MNNLLRLNIRYACLTALSCAIILFTNSCSEVTDPEETVPVHFTVRTDLLSDSASGLTSVTPLRNVQIRIKHRREQQESEVGFTDIQGQAVVTAIASVSGSDFIIEAFSPGHGMISQILPTICNDTNVRFVFREADVTDLNCNTLANSSADFIFTNVLSASQELLQNTPNPVQNCLTVARNNGRDNIEVEIPTTPLGVFTIGAVQINAQTVPVTANPMRVTLPPGSTLGLCLNVNTATTSKGRPNNRFEELLLLKLACPSNTATMSISLQATVVEKTCNCTLFTPGTSQEFRVSEEPVELGQEGRISKTIFTNTSSCPVVVRVKNIDSTLGRNDWRIQSPSALQNAGGEIRLEEGQPLIINALFHPLSATTKSVPSNLTLELEIVPEGDPTACNLTVILSGECCRETCPSLRINNRNQPSGTTARDSLYIRNDKRVFISVPNTPSTITEQSVVSEEYDVILSPNDTLACRTQDAELRVEALPGDQFSLKYFRVNNTRISLIPGNSPAGSFKVTFTAPTKDELKQILLARTPSDPPTTADSMFTVKIIIKVSGCPDQEFLVDAIVTTLPDFTPPIKMHAYRQTTTKQPRPEYEFYVFGNSAVSSLRNENSPPPNDPGQGDLWVEVPNPNGTPPQQPFFKIESNMSWARWQQQSPIPDETLFNNILHVVTLLEQDINAGMVFQNRDAVDTINPEVGGIYIFQTNTTNTNVYGVLVVREINDGTEANLNEQSAIHFRVLYPVVL